MAILWQKRINNKFYEIRSAGACRRLYTNGILHTQYNPNSLITGSVWDLLTLGGFLVPDRELKRVLALGVGGGSNLHQLEFFFQPHMIKGIECNSIHVSLAKRFFDLGRKPFDLVEDDGVKWIKNYQGKPFDLIIDDMFSDDGGEPYRVAKADKKWLDLLASHLSFRGALVLNFSTARAFKEIKEVALYQRFKTRFRLTTGNCENIVAILGKAGLSVQQLRERIREYPELDTRRSVCKLKYAIRTI